MSLKQILWIGLACTGFARADDALKTQLEVFDAIPGQSAPNAYRILFIGDSITRHGASDWTRKNLGWDHQAGMAASSEEKDYVHLLATRIQSTMPDRKVEIYYDSQVTRETVNTFKDGSFADKQARLQVFRDDFHPHLVVVQLGEHEDSQRGVAFMQESCDGLLGLLKKMTPTPDIICAGVWLPGDRTSGRDDYAAGWGAAVENTIRTTCLKYGIPFASVRDFALDPACRGWGSSPGVKWHPNDEGMVGYARVLFAAFEQIKLLSTSVSPLPPPVNDVVMGGSIGTAYRLGLERLGQSPYDSVAYLRADLSHELKRAFINYSGDVSGRYLEIASLTSTPARNSPILEELLRTLPAPQPDGHFGAAVDWNQPLEKPDALTAVKMPILWGHSRLLIGLIEAYGVTHQPRLLELARGIGDFYLATADRFLDPSREAEYRASGTYAASTATCYFPGIEGLVRLHRVTGEDKYLQQARRMADFLPAYDQLPFDHAHGNLLIQLSLLSLYEATGQRAYLERVLKRWDEAMKRGYVWVTGGVGEHFRVSAGFDEGCALADWLRLNLALWRLTSETKYLDAAERLLFNQYDWNRFPNGGYGQLTFRGDASGPFILQPGHHGVEGTWCCTMQGLLGLNNLKDYVLAGSPRGIFVNFPIDATARVRAMNGDWLVTTESLAATGCDRRLRITVEHGEKAGQQARILLRRPPWVTDVKLEADGAAPVGTAEKDGYIGFDLKSGAAVSATFRVRPRLEDRRFGVPALDPSTVARHAKIVLTCGPELLMANADKPPVVVVAVGPDGQLVLPASSDGARSIVTVGSLEADEGQIVEAIRSNGRLKVGPWNTLSRATPIAFVFDAISVPSASALGQALLTSHGEN